jgi:hypothetical protein
VPTKGLLGSTGAGSANQRQPKRSFACFLNTNQFVISGSTKVGTNLRRNYQQRLTYSKDNGKINKLSSVITCLLLVSDRPLRLSPHCPAGFEVRLRSGIEEGTGVDRPAMPDPKKTKAAQQPAMSFSSKTRNTRPVPFQRCSEVEAPSPAPLSNR